MVPLPHLTQLVLTWSLDHRNPISIVFKLQPGSEQVRTALTSDVDMDYSDRPRGRSAALTLIIGPLMVKENLRENCVFDEAGAPAR